MTRNAKSNISKDSLIVVGRMVYVYLHKGIYGRVPSKIDTGADSSSIDIDKVWVDEEGALNYVLFNANSPYHDGKTHKTKDYKVKVVKSSTGHTQIRYATRITMNIETKIIKATFTLTNRNKNTFPILIGARTLDNKFIVDTSLNKAEYKEFIKKNKDRLESYGEILTAESKDNPLLFYNNKYLKQEEVL